MEADFMTRQQFTYEAKGEIVTKIPVVIDCQEGYAIGTFYPDNGSIEVLESSVLNTAFSTPEKYPWVEEQRQELLDDGIIASDFNLCWLRHDFVDDAFHHHGGLAQFNVVFVHLHLNVGEVFHADGAGFGTHHAEAQRAVAENVGGEASVFIRGGQEASRFLVLHVDPHEWFALFF